MKAINDYKIHVRREQPKVDAKKRVALPSLKETILTGWFAAHLGMGVYERTDGTYAVHEDVSEEMLSTCTASVELRNRFREPQPI